VHLLDDDLPEPDVLDTLDRATARGNPLPVRDTTTGPKQAEMTGAGYESAALTS
jgi:hypothetical protein